MINADIFLKKRPHNTTSLILSSILVQDVRLKASKYPVQPKTTQNAMKELRVGFNVALMN